MGARSGDYHMFTRSYFKDTLPTIANTTHLLCSSLKPGSNSPDPPQLQLYIRFYTYLLLLVYVYNALKKLAVHSLSTNGKQSNGSAPVPHNRYVTSYALLGTCCGLPSTKGITHLSWLMFWNVNGGSVEGWEGEITNCFRFLVWANVNGPSLLAVLLLNILVLLPVFALFQTIISINVDTLSVLVIRPQLLWPISCVTVHAHVSSDALWTYLSKNGFYGFIYYNYPVSN